MAQMEHCGFVSALLIIIDVGQTLKLKDKSAPMRPSPLRQSSSFSQPEHGRRIQ
ncbi:hypothetical protein SNOG_16059 [Parastagonospora nodorum SN15]|uniref:Uncharacterized protein n=1 Tax=Phaeosphaeria nodorum (strain SN15 / ATCC MYA-4574 / FGSC 10173) TaxID=321614 RepID=Q0TWZ1_PHANO|nr:hypothetical protein SNOG_16059 [Parastagonospora nodorum SN15]EAT76638.1 hypothetical protein SNOG_16059 [Parastagonospora nodorum SN15]